MMIYLIEGKLKWSHLDVKQDFDRWNGVILKAKQNIDKLYAHLPHPILSYIQYIQQLQYKETPNYDFLISILQQHE